MNKPPTNFYETLLNAMLRQTMFAPKPKSINVEEIFAFNKTQDILITAATAAKKEIEVRKYLDNLAAEARQRATIKVYGAPARANDNPDAGKMYPRSDMVVSMEEAFGEAEADDLSVKPTHILYKTSDAYKPEIICDRNGEVVLDLCKYCGKVEQELLDHPTCVEKATHANVREMYPK